MKCSRQKLWRPKAVVALVLAMVVPMRGGVCAEERNGSEAVVPATVPLVPPSSSLSGGGLVEGGARVVPESEPVFVLPAIYGTTPAILTGGAGRLGKERVTLSGSVSVGYDDNVLQTPSHSLSVNGPKPVGSLFQQAGAGVQFQMFDKRSLFTMDASLGAMRYAERGGLKKDDVNGGLSASYLYKFTPRLQFTAQLNSAYLSQPDLSRANTPQNQLDSEFLSASTRMDLSYRWSPRFTSVVSLSDNLLKFQSRAQQVSDFNETIVGTELQYLIGPRCTLVGEVRAGRVVYPEDASRDSRTVYLLGGTDFRLSPRLSGTLRAGQSVRSFAGMGGGQASPHLEGSLSYRVNPGGRFTMQTRLGFEEPGAAGQERQVWRTSVSYVQALSARLSAYAGVNYLHQTDRGIGGGEAQGSDTVEGSVRLQYFLTRRVSFNAGCTHTMLRATQAGRDYARNRMSLGMEYQF